MPFSLNRSELIGRLGQDPEMRYTPDGQAVTKFSLATDRPAKVGAESAPDWHNVAISSDRRPGNLGSLTMPAYGGCEPAATRSCCRAPPTDQGQRHDHELGRQREGRS